MHFRWSLTLAAIGTYLVGVGSADETDISQQAHLRRPLALALDSDETTLLIANRASGSISIVNTRNCQVTGEFRIGKELSGMARFGDSMFLANDRQQHRLFCFDIAKEKPRIQWQLDVPQYPTSIEVSPDSKTIAVAGSWSRQIGLIAVKDLDQRPDEPKIVELDFVPGSLCWANDAHLLVGDAFSDHLALLNAKENEVTEVHWIDGHRIGGIELAADRKTVLIAEQVLNRLAQSTRNDVHWGLMIANQLCQMPLETLLANSEKVHRNALCQPIGGPENGKADPGSISVCQNGLVVVALGGANQIAFGRPEELSLAFVDVGLRPVALACSVDGLRCFVANMLDDSISVVDLEAMKCEATIPLGPTPELSAAEQGERLFFDARLSHDGWMSCHSCHVDGHTNEMLNDNFSDQSFGNPKRVLSLMGIVDESPLGWNGNSESLEVQIRNSIQVTMQADDPPTDAQIGALAEFVRSIPAPPPIDRARGKIDIARVDRGRELFSELDCSLCHRPPKFTSPDVYDVGIHDEKGNSKFNPPSLIGLGQRDRFFHDLRAVTLEEVFLSHRHQLTRELSETELSELVAFLRSL
jgi:hypothetical protein